MKDALGALAFLLVLIAAGALLGLGIGATARMIAGPPAPPPTCDPGYIYSPREDACLPGYRIQAR